MKHFHSIKDPRNDSAAPVQAAQSKETADAPAPETPEAPATPAPEIHAAQTPTAPEARDVALSKNAALISVLVIISRLTGFVRTWAQAYALGVTVIASCYSVANNLPNQLYELVIGGMLVTAFLPVYLSVKAKLGRAGANRYASNLVTIVFVLMLACTLLAAFFAYEVVFTQSFSAHKGFDVDLCVYFFRFFAIEVVLYALSSLVSGILNAERDYFWSSASPIFNNIVTIASFLAYAYLAKTNAQLALLILAVGNPLGVLIQVLMQVPSLYAHGISIRPYINLKDPQLKETLSIGLPSLVVMLCCFATVSVQTSQALSVRPEGASIAFYARLWFTLPYAILAVPITTAMFTELSADIADNNMRSYTRGIEDGSSKILFFMIPFACFLVIYALPLVRFMAAGNFTPDQLAITSLYLISLSLGLPAYALCMYLQKIASSLREMGRYAAITVLASIVQVLVCLYLTSWGGLFIVGFSSCIMFLVVDISCFIWLFRKFSTLSLRALISTIIRAGLLGCAGSLAGIGVLALLRAQDMLTSASLQLNLLSLVGLLVMSGGVACVVSFGGAWVLHMPEIQFIAHILKRK